MKHLKKLTLLHSNDLHGDFVSEKIDDKLIGGVSMLSGYINKVRKEEDNVIYAIAGDMFRGSIIDSENKGLSAIEIMNLLAPDVASIGNHEVDYGISHLLFIEKCAKFPIINANLYIKSNGARLFSPYYIMECGGMNILFIGLITEDILTGSDENIVGSFVNVEDAARTVGRICNSYKSIDIDFTVLLTHIGFEEDKKLARCLDPDWSVDVIIGGHSHTYIDRPVEENGVLIVQAGMGMDQIGRFDIMVDTDNNCVDFYNWKSVPIDSEHCPQDKQFEKILRKYKEQTDEENSKIVTRLAREITHSAYGEETDMGDLFADILKESLGVDVMMLGSKSIKSESIGPIVDLKSINEAFPDDDEIYMIKFTGLQLKRAVEYCLSRNQDIEFFQFSDGVEIEYSKDEELIKKFYFNGEPLKNDAIISVGIQQTYESRFKEMFNIDIESVSKLQKPKIISTSCTDILVEYMSENQLLDVKSKGRIKMI